MSRLTPVPARQTTVSGEGSVIAYLVLVHRYPEQFKRLFRAIHDPDNHYLIHVDKNSGPALEADIREFLSAYPNAAVLESKKALWGGYSLVDAELRGMEKLLEMGKDWSFFINLSGQDFPLMTQKRIRAFLAQNRGREFIRVLDQARMRPDTMGRVLKHVVELKGRIVDTLATRLFLDGATPYIGTQWKIVSRTFCDFVCHDPSVERYKAFYRNTFIADEGFFQTVMMNTSTHGEVINDDKRMIDWIPDGDIKLRPRTFVASDAMQLTTGQDLFARKFDATEDSEILDLLEAHLRTQDVANVDEAPSAPAPRLLVGA
ncbi:glycosyl transferase [Caulobacter henricii]|uniref:Peptide O-xylosyltransferase n=1 Tax=Caulobacter henricii TaxID=69395 RepID=A0A0N7JHU5_9CAUL|nr:glycosyl transferase [Caulobacter henricii]